jgi:hypothetical protein
VTETRGDPPETSAAQRGTVRMAVGVQIALIIVLGVVACTLIVFLALGRIVRTGVDAAKGDQGSLRAEVEALRKEVEELKARLGERGGDG